jgi:Glycerophosphoryl diester phosphodiesterase
VEFLDNKSYFDGDKPLIIPHRGGSNIVPENTLHGLELAIKEGFSHLKLTTLLS